MTEKEQLFTIKREKIDNLKKFLSCFVCNGIFKEPILILQCTHTFCKLCLNDRDYCPKCKLNLKCADLISNIHISHMIKSYYEILAILNKSKTQTTEIQSNKNSKELNQIVTPDKNIQPKRVNTPKRSASKTKLYVTKNENKTSKVQNVNSGLSSLLTEDLSHSSDVISNDSNVIKVKVIEENQLKETFQWDFIKFITNPVLNDDMLKFSPKCIWFDPQKLKLNKRNAVGETELQKACIVGNDEKVKNLIDQGANVNVVDNYHWSPLHEAAKKGNTTICKLLLEAGAIVDVPNIKYVTPLLIAAEYSNTDVIKVLLEYGADLKNKTLEGTSVESHQPEMEEQLKQTTQIHSITPVVHQSIIAHVCSSNNKILGKCNDVKLSAVVTNNVTHYVVTENDSLPNITIQILQAILKGVWIVNLEWFNKCKLNNEIVDPTPYEIQGTNDFPVSRAMVKSRINTLLLRPKLFHGCKFYIHGDVYSDDKFQITKRQVEDLIKVGEGTILKRVPNSELVNSEATTYPYHVRMNSGKYNHCSYYILYLTKTPYKPEYRFPELLTLPFSWILKCIQTFKIAEIDC